MLGQAGRRAVAQDRSFEKVRFDSGDSFCVGDLYTPQTSSAPAVTIIGPMTFQKEQAPTRYAQALSKLGFVTLAFDPRYRGESGGDPRCLESPDAKAEDLRNSVKFLATRPEVDASRIFVLGICQGSSIALNTARDCARVKGLATIAGQYRDSEGDIDWLTQEGFTARKMAGEESRRKYKDTGEVDYVPGVDEYDMNVGMPGKFVWDWYHVWAERGLWDNRYAVMSDSYLLSYESISAARALTKPWLMIHGDGCFLPTAARRHFDAVPPETRKELIWAETPHLDYYDKPDAIDFAGRHVAEWFSRA